jgi:hypothetical protein
MGESEKQKRKTKNGESVNREGAKGSKGLKGFREGLRTYDTREMLRQDTGTGFHGH